MADRFSLALGGFQVRWQTPTGSIAHLSLDGDLDSLSVPVLRQAVRSLHDAGHFALSFDLAQLRFIDSSGLGSLVEAWRSGQESGSQVTATNPTTAVRRLMDMTGISKFLLSSADEPA